MHGNVASGAATGTSERYYKDGPIRTKIRKGRKKGRTGSSVAVLLQLHVHWPRRRTAVCGPEHLAQMARSASASCARSRSDRV